MIYYACLYFDGTQVNGIDFEEIAHFRIIEDYKSNDVLNWTCNKINDNGAKYISKALMNEICKRNSIFNIFLYLKNKVYFLRIETAI